MSKIKVVQIAKGYDPDGSENTEYLDDQGRVWYATGHWHYPNENSSDGRVWVTDWKQLELPDEPES